jgi:hypothetical protein
MKKIIISTLIILILSSAYCPLQIRGNNFSMGEMTLYKEQLHKPRKRKKEKVGEKDQNKAKHLRKLKKKIKDCGCS